MRNDVERWNERVEALISVIEKCNDENEQLKKDLEESISTANSLDESLIKACSRADSYRIALQSIVEHKFSMDVEKYNDIFDIATEALEGEEEHGVKVNYEGHLYIFGEETIEVEYIGNVNPFKRVGANDE